jgi:hypothetical protein
LILLFRELKLRKPDVFKAIFVTFMLSVILAMAACSGAAASNTGNGPAIASVVAEHTTLYPLGNTNITCSAVSKDGSALNYRWISNDGTITGSGATVNWEAPKTYGNFNIMVVVDDGKGHSSNGTVTVTVIVRDPSKCCK